MKLHCIVCYQFDKIFEISFTACGLKILSIKLSILSYDYTNAITEKILVNAYKITFHINFD